MPVDALKHGTTDVCGLACDTLLARVKGARRHDFVLATVELGSREKAFRALNYTAKSARQGAWEILTDPYVEPCVELHEQAQREKVQDYGTELRAAEATSGRAKMLNVSERRDLDPDAVRHLRQIASEGIEDRDAPGDPARGIPKGRRRATDQELVRASNNTLLLRILPDDEWPQTERDALIDWKETKTGRIIPVFEVGPARARSAKIEGFESMKVTIQEQAQDNAERNAEILAAMEAEELDPLLVQRLLLRIGGLKNAKIQKVLEKLIAAGGEQGEWAGRVV